MCECLILQGKTPSVVAVVNFGMYRTGWQIIPSTSNPVLVADNKRYILHANGIWKRLDMGTLLGVIIGLVMANFMYQWWFVEVANYMVAAERSWFQTLAVIWYYVYVKFMDMK